MRPGFSHRSLHLVLVGNGYFFEDGFVPFLPQPPHHFLSLIGNVPQDDLRAFFGKPFGGGKPDPIGSARNKGGFFCLVASVSVMALKMVLFIFFPQRGLQELTH
jgi:hypothetical protein